MDKYKIKVMLKETNTLCDEYRFATSGLSVEDFNTYVTQLTDLFSSKVKSFVSFFSNAANGAESISKDVEPNEIVKTLVILKADLMQLENINMTKFKDLTFPVTEGLKTNIPMTIKLLTPAMEVINKNLTEYLIATEKVVSDMYTSKAVREAIKPDLTLGNQSKNIDMLYNNLSTIIDVDSHIDRKKLSELLPNLTSLPTAYDDIIELSKSIPVSFLKDIYDRTKRISEKVDTLHKYMIDNKEDIKFSKEAINKLSSYLEDGARYVSYSVSTFYIYHQVIETLKIIVTTLKEKTTK